MKKHERPWLEGAKAAAGDTSPQSDPTAPAAAAKVQNVPRLLWGWPEVIAATGIPRRSLERELAAGRFPRPARRVGRRPFWKPEDVRRLGGRWSTMTPTSFDAWVLARLLSDQPVNGELPAMSEALRPIAERLAATALNVRQGVWDGFLAGQPDANAIIEALSNVRPDQAAPAPGDAVADDGWGPIRLGNLPPAEPFPLDVLPLSARYLAVAAAESIACPVDFPAVAILAAASGIIGQSASLLIKPGYFASASLYVALVGSPSSGKSPALRAVLAPVWEISHAFYCRWQPLMDTWKTAKPDQRGPVPILERIVSTDPTTEALGPILANNPRGLIVAPDEMTKWVMSMDQYKGGKGGDRPFYLSAWNGEPVYVDRAKHMTEPIVVPHPFLTIVGGMTPGMLSTLPEGRGRDDGFVARLLFTYPDRIPRSYSEKGIPADVAKDWERIALALLDRGMRDLNGKPAPRVVYMAPEAARAWSAWCQCHYAEQEADDFPDSLEGAWGKLEAYAARIALVLHMLNLANDPTERAPDDPPALPVRTLEAAFRLVAYFKAHALRVYAAIGGKYDGGGDDVRSMVRWLRRNVLADFSERDITQNLRRFRENPEALSEALAWMASKNLIRPRPEPTSGSKRGRKHSTIYDVNPRLLIAPQNTQDSQND